MDPRKPNIFGYLADGVTISSGLQIWKGEGESESNDTGCGWNFVYLEKLNFITYIILVLYDLCWCDKNHMTFHVSRIFLREKKKGEEKKHIQPLLNFHPPHIEPQ